MALQQLERAYAKRRLAAFYRWLDTFYPLKELRRGLV
jgi:hypothetical protein